MAVRADMQVREITTAIPASLPRFERWGIDYCCGGGRLLGDACLRAGVPVDEVIAEIEAIARESTPPARDFRTAPLAELIDHILATHHERDRAELERATKLASKVHRVHGTKHPELARVDELVTDLRAELELHMLKEERVLFPFIRTLEVDGHPAAANLEAPVGCMQAEHEDAGAALAELRTLTGGFVAPDDACGSYRALYACLRGLEADLHVHIHLENDILFPRALELTNVVRGS